MGPRVFLFNQSADTEGAYRASLLSVLLLLAIPFTQFGFGYWTSVQGVAFLLAALFVRKNISRLDLLLFTVIGMTMLLSLAGHLYSDTLFYAFLRVVRQIICLYLIVCAAATVSWIPKNYFFDVVLPIVVVSLSAMVIGQFVTYTFFGATYLFVPAEFFFGGLATLADRWLEFGSAHGFLADVRAAGPYAEPSYFGFITLSLAMLVLRGVPNGRHQAVLLGLLLIALICSKSASGVLLFALLVLFAFRQKLSLLHWLAILLIAAASLTAADVLLNFPLIDRLINIGDPVLEPSGYVRLVLPLKHIALVLQHQPLGVPMSEFFTFTSRHVESYVGAGIGGPVKLISGVSIGTDNGFLNLFIAYGLGGLVIVCSLPFIAKDKLTLLFLLFAAQFNGDLLAPDKAAVIALVVSCRRATAKAPGVADGTQRFTPPGPFGAMLPLRA